MCLREKNLVWPWLIVLVPGLVALHEMRYPASTAPVRLLPPLFSINRLSRKPFSAQPAARAISLQWRLGEAQKGTDESFARLKCLQTPALLIKRTCAAGQSATGLATTPCRPPGLPEARKACNPCAFRLHGEELKISFGQKQNAGSTKSLRFFYIAESGTRFPAKKLSPSCMEAAQSRSMNEMIFQTCRLPSAWAKRGHSDFVRSNQDPA